MPQSVPPAEVADPVATAEDSRRSVAAPSEAVRNYTGWVRACILYNLVVVAWGAFVRASFSGDGCGSHWPSCGGEIIPTFNSFERVAEFAHRVSSGMVLPMVLLLLWFARKYFQKGHPARRAAVAAVVFTFTEGAIGAFLIRFGLTAKTDSVARTISMSLHMANTFVLLGALVALYWYSRGIGGMKWKGQGAVGWALGVGFGATVIVGITGACSALGHMLKPTDSVLKSALQQGSHYLYKLQLSHPFVAIAVGTFLVFLAGMIQHFRPSAEVKTASRWMLGIYGFQIALGFANIWLEAPIAMQMIHLVLADCLWISVVCVAIFALREGVVHVEDVYFQGNENTIRPKGRELIKQYISLTKPRIISLLLFTTMVTMFIAARGWPGFWLFTWVLIGGYLMPGAANAINMVIDRDIDLRMARTAKRPTVTQEIPGSHALAFAFILATLSFAILWGAANLLTAMMALAGLAFYIVVYTLMLKRRTWQNIVIGGAAGAFPPLVGWAAVTGTLPVMAWVLFGLIFMWTPVHFWALSLLIKDDYAAAGVPMLPVVKGDRYTVHQIILYAILTVLTTLLPFVMRDADGSISVGAIALNVYLVVLCARLSKTIERPQASRLFHYSMLYLALLFVVFAIDRVVL